MASPRFTLTQYLDYVKPLLVDSLNQVVLHKEKLVDKPTKPMDRKDENITAMQVGAMIDIFTRTQLLTEQRGRFSLREALYQVSPVGRQLTTQALLRKENEMLDRITQVDRNAVIALNSVLHGLANWRLAKRPPLKRPNRRTVNNILYMVDISTQHLLTYPSLTMGNMLAADCFSKIYPTKIDYVSATGLWDMVVSEHEPRPVQILKLMAYDILAFDTPEYARQEFTEVGIINPRLEYRYWLACKQFPVETYDTLRNLMTEGTEKEETDKK